MDLLIAFFVLIGGIIVLSVVLAMVHGGDGSDILDTDPTKRLEQRYAAEFEDMDDLLESHNARRRTQGLPEQDADEYALEKQREQRKWG